MQTKKKPWCLDRGDWDWGNSNKKSGIPVKVLSKWLINHSPRDADNKPMPHASHPMEFLHLLFRAGEVVIKFIGTRGQYIVICNKAYEKLMKK